MALRVIGVLKLPYHDKVEAPAGKKHRHYDVIYLTPVFCAIVLRDDEPLRL
jgi:hypothetical protein